MKKFTRLLLLTAFLAQWVPGDLFAKKITVEQAKQQAYSFWGEKMPQKARAKSRVATTAGLLAQGNSYYVFNNDAGGFVIISGDDAVAPVLGYTTTGNFDVTSLPDGLKDLLASYDRQISAIGNAPSTTQANTFVGEKMLYTAKWNQNAPFNKYVPDNLVTGCVATAGAIVMKYHGYPSKGQGSHSYVWNGRTLSADFGHDYDWTGMPAYYDGTNGEAFDGVARLMADLGVAVEMNYTKDGSGAYLGSLVTAQQKYFGYSKYARLMSVDDLGAEAWNERLRAEIDANRPVLYSASDASVGGHAFVIDGYKDERFSVNWGWGGYCDGFYQMGALNPESDGKPTGDQFNIGQSAVFDLQPSDGTEKISPLGFIKMDGCLEKMNMNVTDVKSGQDFTLYTLPLQSQGEEAFQGEVALALKNAKGETLDVFASTQLTSFNPGYYYSTFTFYGKSTVDAQAGDYLAVVTKADGSDEYIEVCGPDFTAVHLPATGYEPRTFEVIADLGEGAHFVQASGSYNWSSRFYNGKPLQGCPYYFDITVDEGIDKYFVEMDGKALGKVRFSNGAEFYGIDLGVKPEYRIEVKTYRNYEEKSLEVNMPQAGALKEELEKLNLDYHIYTQIKVNGDIDKRDFDELNSHPFKSIDLSGSKVVAYGSYQANMVPDYAFDSNNNLEHFKMPEGVEELGFNAFKLTSLKEIDLPETIQEFGRNTFWGCHQLADVYMRHQEAPYWISWCVFYNKGNEVNRTLHLYPGCKAKYEAYQYTQNWIVNFDAVVEDLTSGILAPTRNGKEQNAPVYDLNGRRMPQALPNGLYIQNGKKFVKR